MTFIRLLEVSGKPKGSEIMNLYQISDYECWCLSVGKNEKEAQNNAWNNCRIREASVRRKLAVKCLLHVSQITEIQGYKIKLT